MRRPLCALAALLLVRASYWCVIAKEDFRESPVVALEAGRISGKVLLSEKGRQYYAYTGIPYAEPPTGNRRFKFPKRLPGDAWTGVKKCVGSAPKCPQLTFPERQYVGDEDCLYLNVYTHRLEDLNKPVEELVNTLRPVLFWIHGGGFQHGSSDFDAVGPERFMDNKEDLVLVTANYRLNALGFLSIGEAPAVGNAGLKDQFSALSWVQANIAHFGGHPRRVTLGGSQAGGSAAHLHALSPLSSGEPDMFLQTLSMSGNALVPWAVLPAAEARRRAVRLGRLLGCGRPGPGRREGEDEDAPGVVRCLRTKPAEDIVRHAEDVLDWRSDISFPFVPCVENFDGHHRPFMIAHPRELLQRNHSGVRQKTWVAGVTTHEGLPQALQLMVYGGLRKDLEDHFEERIWDYLGMSHVLSTPARRAAGQRLRNHYLQDQPITLATLPSIIELTSDALYFHSLREAVAFHAATNRATSAPTLVYRFGYNRKLGRREVLGIPQSADVELIFPAVFAGNKSSLEEGEQNVANKLLHLLTNFVAQEDPTPQQEKALDDIEWPPVTGADFPFVDVTEGGHLQVNDKGFYSDRLALWQSIYQEIEKVNGAAIPIGRKIQKDEL